MRRRLLNKVFQRSSCPWCSTCLRKSWTAVMLISPTEFSVRLAGHRGIFQNTRTKPRRPESGTVLISLTHQLMRECHCDQSVDRRVDVRLRSGIRTECRRLLRVLLVRDEGAGPSFTVARHGCDEHDQRGGGDARSEEHTSELQSLRQ